MRNLGLVGQVIYLKPCRFKCWPVGKISTQAGPLMSNSFIIMGGQPDRVVVM